MKICEICKEEEEEKDGICFHCALKWSMTDYPKPIPNHIPLNQIFKFAKLSIQKHKKEGK